MNVDFGEMIDGDSDVNDDRGDDDTIDECDDGLCGDIIDEEEVDERRGGLGGGDAIDEEDVDDLRGCLACGDTIIDGGANDRLRLGEDDEEEDTVDAVFLEEVDNVGDDTTIDGGGNGIIISLSSSSKGFLCCCACTRWSLFRVSTSASNSVNFSVAIGKIDDGDKPW